MIHLSQEELRKLQLTELEMLIEFDRVCRKHNIQYSLDGGTLLGAIRHKGYIPWDDDADLCMTRPEYEKLYRVWKKEADTSKFFLQEYRTDRYYPWGYSKIRRRHSRFLREGQEHLKYYQGIFVDIFIYDNVPDTPGIRQLYHFACDFIRKSEYASIGRRMERNPVLRMGYGLMARIPNRFLQRVTVCLAKSMEGKKTELARHITHNYPKRCFYGLPRRCFDNYIDAEFEGHIFRIFREYDLYLVSLYGDYMTLPPVEERQVHPVTEYMLPGEELKKD